MQSALYVKSSPTGALFNPDKGVADAFGGSSPLPRSIASDGRRSVLALHVLVHLAALAFNIVAAIYAFDTFPQSQIQVGVVTAAAVHGVGILCLLALAASEIKQLAFVLSVSFILWALSTALIASVLMLVFSYRTDDLMTTPLWTGATSVILQTFGISLLIANTLNMAAHADNAFSKKPEEAQPLTAGEAA